MNTNLWLLSAALLLGLAAAFGQSADNLPEQGQNNSQQARFHTRPAQRTEIAWLEDSAPPLSDVQRLKLLKPAMNLDEVNRVWQGKRKHGEACGTALDRDGKEQAAYWCVYLLDLPDAKEPQKMKFGYIQVEPPYLFEFSGPGFQYRLQNEKFVALDPQAKVKVSGRLVSREYEKLGGKIERSIIRVTQEPGNEMVVDKFYPGSFEFELPPGRYELQSSANGSRGATFKGDVRPLLIEAYQPALVLGEIDLPITRTTSLFDQPAPELDGVLAWIDTRPLTLKGLRGKVVLLDFFAHYCSICHAHKPDLVRLQEKYGPQGLVVLALHDNSLKSVEEFHEAMDPILNRIFKGNAPHLPMALDVPQGVFQSYGIGAVPAMILIDQQGRVVRRFHHAGVPELAPEIQRLLASQDQATR